MAKKKVTVKRRFPYGLTPDEIQKDFIALINSCVEGYTGEWDPLNEGRTGFESMEELLRKLARHYKVDVSEAKGI